MNRNYSIFDISQFAETNHSAIIYLQGRHLIKINLNCQRCGSVMQVKEYAGSVNLGHKFRCPHQGCRATQSLILNTFLKIYIFLYINIFIYFNIAHLRPL